MDGQDLQDKGLRYEKITRDIIGCAFEVINELGIGFLESVYEKALLIALKQRGLAVTSQRPIAVLFRGAEVGTFYADLLVDEKVIVELKAAKAITPEHQAQVINYLQATGIEVGLLINFGNPKLEYRRFTRTKKSNMDTQDEQDQNRS
jgi:GxxExxY protein